MKRMPRVKADDPIAAEGVNSLYGAIDDLDSEVVNGGRSRWMYVKLTGLGAALGTGRAYAWTQQIQAPGGTWVDGTLSGTTTVDPAVEVNGNAAVPLSPNPIVIALRNPFFLAFEAGAC